MRNRFLIIVMLFAAAVSAFGQGGSVNRQVIAPTVSNNGTGQPASFANIRFCPSTATGFPCSPLIANVFSDQALTQGLPAAFAADTNGNYTVFVPTGTYLVQESNAVGAGYTFQYSWFWFVNGTGTVSSVSLSVPASLFTITGSPCTTACNLSISLVNAPALNVFANCTGSPTLPAFCLLTANMLPTTLNATTINGLTVNGNETVSGTLGVNGATTLSSSLGVAGPVTLSSTLNVIGSMTAGGTLTVNGAATLSGGGALAGTFTGSPTLSGNPIFSGIPVFGTANFTTGIKLGGSFGINGQCLQSTGSGTTFTSSCGFGGTPIITSVGGGAGAGGTATLATGSTDKIGIVQVSTGTAPSAAAFIFNLTFSTPFPTFGSCTWSQSGGGVAVSLVGGINIANAIFSISPNGTALTASSSYFFAYSCNGY